MDYFGPRLRDQSTFAVRTAVTAINEGVGVVVVFNVPPAQGSPVEVKTYPWGTDVHAHGETTTR